MDKEIKNKTLVVTGGANGIGFEIANRFLKEQAKLAILLDINEDKGQKAAEELCSKFGENKAVFMKCDVIEGLEENFQKICEKYNKIDIFIYSAGVVNEVDPKPCVDVNLTAAMKWSFKFLEHMKKDAAGNGNGGTIINLASIFGYRISFYCPVYHATKFGLIGFTKSLGHKKNYDRNGVRVIAICPGFTRTAMTEYLLEGNTEDCLEAQNAFVWQSVEDVGDKSVEIFKRAESGSIWEIEAGNMREVI